jgi:hypothetical protein
LVKLLWLAGFFLLEWLRKDMLFYRYGWGHNGIAGGVIVSVNSRVWVVFNG